MKKPIWFDNYTLDAINHYSRGTMIDHIGIAFTEIGDDYLKATMPVDRRTFQPAKLLHGGATVALAETLGSTAGGMVIDRGTESVVGLEINANHLRSSTEGVVEGVCRPLHLGRSTHVWEIHVSQGGKLVSVSRLTLAILKK
jgi:1,4-dihydroxy-2-naphthoyl-CoA hydrolase